MFKLSTQIEHYPVPLPIIKKHLKLIGLHLDEYLSRNMGKRTLWHVRPTNTQISLHIRAVWLESSFYAWIIFVTLAIQNALVKILMRECAGWSESSQGAHVRRLIFWRGDSFTLMSGTQPSSLFSNCLSRSNEYFSSRSATLLNV